jgi:hypothetical protein
MPRCGSWVARYPRLRNDDARSGCRHRKLEPLRDPAQRFLWRDRPPNNPAHPELRAVKDCGKRGPRAARFVSTMKRCRRVELTLSRHFLNSTVTFAWLSRVRNGNQLSISMVFPDSLNLPPKSNDARAVLSVFCLSKMALPSLLLAFDEYVMTVPRGVDRSSLGV